MAVGDSITHGTRGEKSYRYEFEPLLSQTECSFEMVGSQIENNIPTGYQSPHEGYSAHQAGHFVNGNTNNGNPGISTMMSNTPDVVFLHLGSNDMRQAQTVTSTINEIDQIVTEIWNANPDAEVLIANVIPWFGTSPNNVNVESDVQSLGTAIENWVSDENDSRLHLVDVRSQFTVSMMTSDLIHPNPVGEAHIAGAFYDVFSSIYSCAEPRQLIDSVAPETFISVPEDNTSVGGTTTYSGYATDAGGSGFDRVQVAIGIQNGNSNPNQWYNFTDGTFGPIRQSGVAVGITNANLTNTTNARTDWSINATLPPGDYTFYALAVDNEGNDAFHGTGLSVWPENKSFIVTTPAHSPCNGSQDATLTNGSIDSTEYGWKWGTNDNQDNVTTCFENTGADINHSVTGHDIDFADEVQVFLNNSSIGFLARGSNNQFNNSDTFVLPLSSQVNGLNEIRFEQRTSGFRWGVTNMELN